MERPSLKPIVIALWLGCASSVSTVWAEEHAKTPATPATAAPAQKSVAPTTSDVPLVNLGAELERFNGEDKAKPEAKHTTDAKVDGKADSAHKTTEPKAKVAPKTPIDEPVIHREKASHANKPTTQSDHAKKQTVHSSHAVHWGYSGKGGPAHWGDLSSKNLACKIGKNQSPIDLREQASVGTIGLPSLDLYYRDKPLSIINNGHTIQVNYPAGSYIMVGGHRYELLQYHFHTPSEHHKEGVPYPMEVHMVHKDSAGNLAVLGLIFREGDENPTLNALLDHLPTKAGKETLYPNTRVNPIRFLPGDISFYKYSGSLTTPPCSEGVSWMVFKQTVSASPQQIQRMRAVMGENARPIQSLNSRQVLKSWGYGQMQEEPLYEFY